MNQGTNRSDRKVKGAALWAWTALTVLVCLLLTGLGIWQWQRGEWKTRLLVAHAAALEAPAIPLARALDAEPLPRRADLDADAAQAALALPLKVRTEGRFEAADTVLLDNQRRGAQVGARVFTAFTERAGGRTLMVDRGWVALDAQRQLTLDLTPPAGEVALSGLLAPPPATGIRLGPAPEVKPGELPLLTFIDLAALSAGFKTPLQANVLRLEAGAPGAFIVDPEVLPNTLPPEKHRGYAVQWWGMAIAVAVIYGVLRRRRWRAERARADEDSTPNS